MCIRDRYLLQLPAAIMEHREYDAELLEYLSSPPAVQLLSPETWVDVWVLVCGENSSWLEMREGRLGVTAPFCRKCSEWASLKHLSDDCKFQREARPSVLLRGILEAESSRRKAYIARRSS